MPKQTPKDTVQVDNAPTAKAAKVAIRRNVMARIKGPVHVFDAFAGSGEFYRQVWKDAASYTACDRRYFADERRAFVADNRRVLRAIDLSRFNLFDLDAYGAPWEQAIIIAARRKVKPGETVGFVFTEGNGMNYKNNIVPRSVTNLIGLRGDTAVGLFRRRAEVHNGILSTLAKRMGAGIVARWQATGRTGASVAYIGVVFSGAAQPAAGSGNRQVEMAEGLS